MGFTAAAGLGPGAAAQANRDELARAVATEAMPLSRLMASGFFARGKAAISAAAAASRST